MSAVNLMET